MIFIVHGDMFESNTEALVNPVNCVGVMGKGLALAFKNKFPDNYNAYRKVCQEHSLFLAASIPIVSQREKSQQQNISSTSQRKIIGAIYRSSSISRVVCALAKTIDNLSIRSIAMP